LAQNKTILQRLNQKAVKAFNMAWNWTNLVLSCSTHEQKMNVVKSKNKGFFLVLQTFFLHFCLFHGNTPSWEAFAQIKINPFQSFSKRPKPENKNKNLPYCDGRVISSLLSSSKNVAQLFCVMSILICNLEEVW
jgi:hypothetical protein